MTVLLAAALLLPALLAHLPPPQPADQLHLSRLYQLFILGGNPSIRRQKSVEGCRYIVQNCSQKALLLMVS